MEIARDESNALTRIVTIQNRFGIHARPAALFVKTANRFQCDISVEKDDVRVSGKSIIGLMTIEGYQGATIRISATGADAPEALDALEELVAQKFFED
ncbi:MAG: HPr family phosphocarrier protein [Verrucomicrobia bacterium]|nr:MAG: HPr family phosphocarrier protein [Verrucomicrobiota bacterium]